jgi:nucleotide-binding universal stress UspA family protein
MNGGITMRALKNILFPIDFSECSTSVFPFALDLAQRFDARLHILFVARDISYFTAIDMQGDMLMNTVAEVARAGENQMEKFCRQQMGGYPNYETKVVIGNPADEIVAFADRQGVDLVIMSTHGRKGLDRTLMGSVADHVMKNAAIPVLTVNPFRPRVKHVKA